MVRNEEKFQEAVKLRKRGFTLAEIARYCGVAKSTVSNWLKEEYFSRNITKLNKNRAGQENAKRLKLINKSRQVEREKKYQEAIKDAEVTYEHFKSDPLFVAGLMLYVGEGDNKHRRLIRLANSRMDIHQIFIVFIIKYLGVERSKIRFWVLLYPDLNEEKVSRKWSKSIGIPLSQFHKNQVIAGKSTKRTLHNGVGNTIIGSTVLKYKLNRWIELATTELSNT